MDSEECLKRERDLKYAPRYYKAVNYMEKNNTKAATNILERENYANK